MNARKMTTLKQPSFRAIVAGLLVTLCSAGLQAGEAYSLVVYNDSDQGKRLIRGEYEAVLDGIGKTPFSRFERSNNLCGSRVLAKDFQLAEEACDAAVAATANQYGRAMALSNRGVLHALKGERQLARADFEMAIDLSDDIAAAASNLERLEAKPSLAFAQ